MAGLAARAVACGPGPLRPGPARTGPGTGATERVPRRDYISGNALHIRLHTPDDAPAAVLSLTSGLREPIAGRTGGTSQWRSRIARQAR